MSSGIKFFIRGLIYTYRWGLSPLKMTLFGAQARCRFEPCCSSYALEALELLPIRAAFCLIVKRIARCHPWGGNGVDPVVVPDNK